ncbi:MAG: glycosyltransferase [Planctomycetes bacterium]|nr:glycosyltransferase [Planctomycetota bacterium]
MRVVWFGSYAKGPGYPRSETLISGLRSLGHEVLEVHAPLLSGAGERVDLGRGGGAAGLAWRQAKAAVSLARGWFRDGECDAVVVGYGGIVDVPLLRMLQGFDRVPLLWDAFVPLYDAVVRDRGLAAPDSLRAKSLLRLERLAGRGADAILADTGSNADLLAVDLRVSREKIAVVPVSQPDPGEPAPLPLGGPLRVLLVTSHIPLHGVSTVIEAAGRLRGDGVAITVAGTGQGVEDARRAAAGVPGLELVPRFVSEDEVRKMLAGSHVGLGVFGATEKAARVVPLKAVLTIAAGRALVTLDGPASREALGDDALLVPAADPDALAAALVRLRDDRGRVERLGAAGRRRYLAQFTPEAAARTLLAVLARFRP